MAAAVGVEPTNAWFRARCLAVWRRRSWQTARGSNPSLWIESPLTSPEVERFNWRKRGRVERPRPFAQLARFSRPVPSPHRFALPWFGGRCADRTRVPARRRLAPLAKECLAARPTYRDILVARVGIEPTGSMTRAYEARPLPLRSIAQQPGGERRRVSYEAPTSLLQAALRYCGFPSNGAVGRSCICTRLRARVSETRVSAVSPRRRDWCLRPELHEHALRRHGLSVLRLLFRHGDYLG